MSTPTPSPLPGQSSEISAHEPHQHDPPTTASSKDTSEDPLPRLRIHFDDISHPATAQFLTLIDPTRLLPNAIHAVFKHLYPSSLSLLRSPPREVRSITLILRPMSGVAYTTGLPLDDAHKEIHLSLDYVRDCASDGQDARRRDEIIGVVTHEMVHCFQHDAHGTAPAGLIEGIADYVRLKAGLAPPHWEKKGKREVGERWDEGYQKTAFFLEWMEREEVGGREAVARINAALRGNKEYKEEDFWRKVVGENVGTLWERYVEWRKEKDGDEDGNEDGDGDGEKEKRSEGGHEKVGNGRDTGVPEGIS